MMSSFFSLSPKACTFCSALHPRRCLLQTVPQISFDFLSVHSHFCRKSTMMSCGVVLYSLPQLWYEQKSVFTFYFYSSTNSAPPPCGVVDASGERLLNFCHCLHDTLFFPDMQAVFSYIKNFRPFRQVFSFYFVLIGKLLFILCQYFHRTLFLNSVIRKLRQRFIRPFSLFPISFLPFKGIFTLIFFIYKLDFFCFYQRSFFHIRKIFTF